MKYLLLCLALAGCSAFPPAALPALPSPPWESVYRLDFADGGRCSAVGLGPGLFVTAAHCSRVGVLKGYGPVSPALPSPEGDIALGKAELPHWAMPSASVPVVGSPLILAGFGCQDLVRPSVWLSAGPVGPSGEYLIAGPVCHGDSGGGVFSADGRLVAIMTGHLDTRGYVVPLSDLASILQ